MKKFLVVLLALALVGGFVFAQDAPALKITGSVQSGIMLQATDNSDVDPYVRVYSQDAGTGTRLDLNGAYTNADANAGFNFKLRTNADNMTFDALRGTFADFAYGWLKAFDSKLTVYGGKVDNGTFSSAGGIDTDLGEGFGLMAVVSPIAGLDFGLGWYSSTAVGFEFEDTKFKINAAYTVPDLLKITAGFRTHDAPVRNYENLGKDAEGNTIWGDKVTTHDEAIYVGVRILALASAGISNLSVDAELDNLGDFGDTGIVKIGERLEGAAGDLGYGIRLRQALKMGDAADADTYSPSLHFNLWGFYALGNIVPRLDVGFVVGESKIKSKLDDPRKPGDGLAFASLYAKDASSLEIRPSVQFRFGGSGAFIELGYALFVDLTKDIKDTNKTSMVHDIYLDYKVSF